LVVRWGWVLWVVCGGGGAAAAAVCWTLLSWWHFIVLRRVPPELWESREPRVDLNVHW
jgi:hypothetical protein